MDAHRTVEAIARASYGRLVAYLSARTRDVAGAEDALGESLLAALASWPRDGVPEKPEAWLLTAARHRLADQARHARVRADHAPTLERIAAEAGASSESDSFPDRRLELLFVCAHPAIDASVHTPLMHQTVLGLDAARIAQAFLVAPAAMGQRLVRGRTKIREAGIPFEVPEERDLPRRLDAVLEAIYAAFGLGFDETAGADPCLRELADEAIWLARALLERMPEQPEARGLLALMLFSDSRRRARRDRDGRYVPLSEQDPADWSLPRILEAERELAAAAQHGRPGRFQLEAAIQSVHAERRETGRTDWQAIALFHEALLHLAPTLGGRVARAAAVGEARGPEQGLALLDEMGEMGENAANGGREPAAIAAYQPYWAVRAHLLRRLGRAADATAAFDRAIGLATDDAVRRFLLERRGGAR